MPKRAHVHCSKSAVRMASGGDAESLTEAIRGQLLQCKICLDDLREPKTLPCLHTFCAECVHYYIEHSRVDRHKFACPICRRHVYIPQDGADGFPDSFFVTSLTDIVDGGADSEGNAGCGICRYRDAGEVDAVMTCVECHTSLCAECATAHSSASVTSGHTLLPVSGTATCREHAGESLRYYCETCCQAICVPCTFLTHAGHTVGPLGAAKDGATAELASLTQHATDSLLQLGAARDQLAQLDTELFMRREAAKTAIRRQAQRLARKITQHEHELVAEVDEYFDAAPLARDRQHVQRTVSRLESALSSTQNLLAADTLEQLAGRAEARTQLAEALDYEVPDVGVHALSLHRYVHFLPAAVNVSLGCLLQSSESAHSHSLSQFRPCLPTSRAILLHRLPQTDDVIAITFLPLTGCVVLLCSGDERVHVYDMDGQIKRTFSDPTDLPQPSDIATTHSGDIAIADCELCAVKVYDSYGTINLTFGDTATLGLPVALAVDNAGFFLVCDQLQRSITRHSSAGEMLSSFSVSESHVPRFICLADDKLYVADTQNSVVAIYMYADGTDTEFLAKMSRPLDPPATDSSSNGDEMFLDCSGICSDRRGGIIVSDRVSNRLQVYNNAGETSVLLPAGQPLLAPTVLSLSVDHVLAVAVQRPAVTLDGEMAGMDICLYRVIKADI